MDIVATLDDMGKPAWITLMVLAFIIFWPLGLAILFYLFWSGRMGCGKRRDWGKADLKRWSHYAPMRGTGNRAFDEYRQETLRRLEDEADEFRSFLERLREAKDKAEFDQFMAERKKGSDAGPGAVPSTT